MRRIGKLALRRRRSHRASLAIAAVAAASLALSLAAAPAGALAAEGGALSGEAPTEPAAAPPSRPPMVLSVAVAAVVPSAGIDLSVRPARWVALGAQLTTLVVHWDLSLRARAFPLGGPEGPYLGAAAHLWYSPLVLSQATGGASAEVGWELRRPGGSVVGVGLGAGAFRQPAGSASPDSPASWEWLPMANLRIGRAW